MLYMHFTCYQGTPSKPFKHALTIQAVFFVFVTIINITILKHQYNNMVG